MGLRSFRDMNPFVIGVVSVATLAVGVALAFAVGILHLFEDSYSVTAVFRDTAGISSGDDVRVAGVKVGRVGSVDVDRRQGNVRVELVVDSGIELGPTTRAEIALETLLGTKYVRLAGPVDEPYLADGDVIPIDRTAIPFDVFELAKEGTELIEESDTERLNLLVDQLATVAEGRRADFEALFDGLEEVAGAVNEREAELRVLLDRVETIATTLDEKDRVLVRLLDQSAGVLSVLDDRRTALADGLEAADQLTGQLASLVATHKAALDDLLTTLHPTVEILDRRQEDLDRALSWLGPGTLGLAKAVDHGPWADVFVKLTEEDPSSR